MPKPCAVELFASTEWKLEAMLSTCERVSRFLTGHQHNWAKQCHWHRYMLENMWRKTNRKQTHYKN